jgi:uncharacterized membrane protein YoaK (UPF0700 family)
MASTGKTFAGIPKRDGPDFLLSLAVAYAAAYVDAAGFLLFSGVYLSFMSGNSTRAAVLLGKGAWSDLVPVICVFPAFVLGAAIGTVMMNTLGRYRQAVALLTAGAVLGIIAVQEARLIRSQEFPLGSLLLLTAVMGLLNPTVQRVDKVSVGLTYITGALAKLGNAIGSKTVSRRNTASSQDQTESIIILTSVWLSFLIGATCGGIAAAHYGLHCIIVPAALLLLLGVLCCSKPPEKNRPGGT